MKKLRDKKYFALIGIILIFLGVVFINKIGSIDKYAGQIKVTKAYVEQTNTSLSANVIDIVNQNNSLSKGYDEVDYLIKYYLDENKEIEERNVLIKAKLSENEKYASFKKINIENIESTLSENKKEILIKVKNAKVGQENEVTLKLLVEGAPNGYKINPEIEIKEETEEKYTSIATNIIEIKTNSVTGIVKDTNNLPVSNIELKIIKNEEEIKRTYTDNEGKYIFTDLEEGNYQIEVEEEIYEKVNESSVTIKDGQTLDLIVKQVRPYEIKINKYITNLKIINNGNEKNYVYGEIEKVQQSIKNLKSITGEIKYKIVVQNVGTKEGIVTVVKDEIPEGLKFDKNKNTDWIEKEGILYNRTLEGVTLKANQKIEVSLVLDIESTKEAKTYINKVTAKGEIYERVVYILNDQKYKEEEVLEGEKIQSPNVTLKDFQGWYTDKNYTNKYNFDNEVTKDLILYGKIDNQQIYKVEFYDNNKLVKELSKEENKTIKEKELPEVSKKGYTFKYWSLNENGEEYDIKTPIKSDIKLYSVYDINKYKVEFYDKDKKIETLEKEYNSNIINTEVPNVSKEGYSFIGWYEENENESFDFTTKITKDIKLYSKYKITTNAVIFNDENRITTKEVEYGSVVEPIKDQGKEGHTFSHWSEEINGTPFDFNTPIKETTTLYTVYVINKYNVEFIDQGNSYNIQEIEYQGSITKPENPIKIGHSFKYWSLKENGSEYDLETKVIKNIKLYSVYEINDYTVKFMDKGLLYKTETVKYNEKVKIPESPTKDNNIFIGWTLNDNLYDFTLPVTDNITLYSKYEEVEKPVISHMPTEWTNDKVTVIIKNDNHPDYSFIYKIDDGQYQNYTGVFNVEKNCTVIAKSIKNNIESIIETHEIDNIDKISPTIISFEQLNPMTNSFDINIKAVDNESGLKEIKIYKNDIYETSIIYSDNYNEEKNAIYNFNGLEEKTAYRIKVQAVDVAGNVSEEIEKEFSTTQTAIVARIIGRENSLYESEDNYENFTSLANAINACPTGQCTIQMVLSTNESVDVLQGQDITLDVNGKTIKGVSDYTIQNSGELIIVDNAEESGSIINLNDITLKNINTGLLQLGINEEPLVVSIEVPNIIGTNYGVYTEENATFNFFDGRVEAKQAIKGIVDETPYLYNAKVEIEDNQVATLTILAEAEARIDSVYYTKVAQAVDESNNGYYTEGISDSILLQNFESDSIYGFDYNEETNTLISNNKYEASIANSYTIIDLTNYEYDQKLEIAGYLTNIHKYNSKTSKGSIIIRENSSTGTLKNPMLGTGNFESVDETETKYLLEKGKKYYISLSHENPGFTYGGEIVDSKLVITKMYLSKYETDDYETDISSLNSNTLAANYGFDYDENTKTYKSNNQYTTNSKAFSYIEIDLTNETKNKELIINASLDTMYYNNYGNIIINEDNKIYDSVQNSSNITIARINTGYSGTKNELGPYNFTKVLTAGKKYYLQFYYFKNNDSYTKEQYIQNDCSDTFTINTIDLIDVNEQQEIKLSELKTPGEYGFIESGTYGYPSNDIQSVDNTTAHSYFEIDLTKEKINKIVKIKASPSKGNFYIALTKNKEMPSVEDAFASTVDNSLYNFEEDITLEKGNIYYIHYVYNRTTYNLYPYIYPIQLTDGVNLNLATEIKTVGVNGFDEYDSYDKAYIPSVTVQGTIADSFIKIDLSKEESNQVLTINSSVYNNSNTKYFYLTNNPLNVPYSMLIKNKKDSLLFYDNKGNYSGASYNFYDYKYILEKGNIYYLHFGMNFKYETTYDFLSMKNIKLTPVNNNILNIGKTNVFVGTETKDNIKTYLMDETDDENLRFIGKNPDNYVKFNDEVWRIIGVFDTKGTDGTINKRIKLIRNDSIGLYSWDTSDSSSPTGSDGYGINEWSQADLMKLLNPGYEDETIGGSLYWNKKSGNCYNGSNNKYTTCDFTTTGLNDDSKKMIDTIIWNTGAVPNEQTNINAYHIYEYERSNNHGKTNYVQTDTFPIDDVERTTTWKGKVGLLYLSDYIMAASDGSSSNRDTCLNSYNNFGDCVYNSDWLWDNNANPLHTITPLFGDYDNGKTKGYPFLTLYATSGLGRSPAHTTFAVKPTIYLSTKAKIKSGSGTSTDPYEFELGENDNQESYYGLTKKDVVSEENIIIEEKLTDDYSKIKKSNVYSFSYDAATNSYTNDNKGIPYSLATSYITIDMTNEKTSKDIIFTYSMKSDNYTKGYINLMKDNLNIIDYNNPNSSSNNSYKSLANGYIAEISNTNGNNVEVKSTLEAGHIYYVQFAYYKKSTQAVTESISDSLNVSFKYIVDTEKTEEYKKISDITPVLNTNPDTVQLLKNISVTDTIVIDETRNVIIDLNGKSLTTNLNNYIIENNGELTIIDSIYEKTLSSNLEEYNNKLSLYKNSVLDLEERYSNEYNETLNTEYHNDNLKVYYEVADSNNTSNELKDLSGNNNNGAIHGAVIENNYLLFDGTDDYVETNPQNYNNVTVEIVYDQTKYIHGDISLVNNSNYGLKLNNGEITSNVKFNEKENNISSNYYAAANNIYYASMTYDGKMQKLYVNGILINSSEVNSEFDFNNSLKFLLGAKYSDDQYSSFFKGKIYSFRLYNKVLSEEEIKKNYYADNNKYTINSLSKIEIDENIELDVNNFSFFVENPAIYSSSNYNRTNHNMIYNGNSSERRIQYATGGFNNKSVIYNNSKISVYENLPLNISGQIQIGSSSYSSSALDDGNVTIGLARTKEITTEDFVAKNTKKINSQNALFNFDITVSEPGDYYLKIIVETGNYSSTQMYYVLIGNVSYKFAPILTETERMGNISSSTGNIINNKETGKLNLKSGVISSLISTSIAVYNLGELSIFKDFMITNTSSYLASGVHNLGLINKMSGTVNNIYNGTPEGAITYFEDTEQLREYESDGKIIHLDGKTHGTTNNTWQSVTGNNATITGATWDGYALKFDGKDDYVSIPYGSSLSNITIEAVISDRNLKSSDTCIICRKNSFELGIYNNIYGGEINKDNPLTNNYMKLSNEKVSVAMTYDGYTQKIYINGKLVNEKNNKNKVSMAYSSDYIYLGNNKTNSSDIFFNGEIYSIRVYNKILNDEQISQNYNVDNKRYIEEVSNPKYGQIYNADGVIDTFYNESKTLSSLDNITINNKFENQADRNLKMNNVEIASINNRGKNLYINNSKISGLITNFGNIYFDNTYVYSIDNDNDVVLNNNTIIDKYETNTNSSINVFDSKINEITHYLTSSSCIDQTLINLYNGSEINGNNISLRYITFNMYDGIVNADIQAYYNSKINIYGGQLNGNIINNKGNLNIGINDGTVNEYPKIYGSIKKGAATVDYIGTFNFYDGWIIGESTIELPINEIPENYDLQLEQVDENIYKMYLAIPTEPVAQIGEEKYYFLQDAIDSIAEDNTDNVEIDILKTLVTAHEITNTKNITIDANGYNFFMYPAGSAITNSNKLILKDSLEDEFIRTINSKDILITNSGIVSLDDFRFYGSISSSNEIVTQKGIYDNFYNSGKAILNGSILFYDLQNNESGVMELIDCDFYSDETLINTKNATLTITGGKYTNTLGTTEIPVIANQGILTINGGNYEVNSNGYTVYNEGNTTINGGTFKNRIENTANSTMVINKAFISENYSSTNALINSGMLTMIDGNVTAKSGSGITNSATGTLTVGQKGDKDENGNVIVSKTSPVITGSGYGVYNLGIFNFYDGILTGSANNSIYGTVTEVEEGYDIIKEDVSTSKQSAYLAINPVAKILSTNKEYATIQAAINDVADATDNDTYETIQILRDVSLLSSGESIVIPENKNIIFDLNSYTLKGSTYTFWINNGNIQFKDSSTETSIVSKITIETTNNLFENNGTMLIDLISLNGTFINTGTVTFNKSEYNGTYTNTGTTTIDSYGYTVNTGSKYNSGLFTGTFTNNNKMTINYGEFKNSRIDNTGEFEINDISYTGRISNTGDFIINKGTITGDINNSKNLTINGGTIKKEYNSLGYNKYSNRNYFYTINNIKDGVLNLNGGYIKAGYSGYSYYFSTIYNEAVLNINGADIAGTSRNAYGILSRAGEINMLSGKVDSYYSVVIYNTGATFNMYGGTLDGSSSDTYYYAIVHSTDKPLNIYGGTINSPSAAGINADDSPCVIGKKSDLDEDGNVIVSESSPKIYAPKSTALSGTDVYFYDGEITGNTYGFIETEQGYNIINDNSKGYDVKTVKKEKLFKIKSTEEEYYLLQDAINAVTNSGETIQILNNFSFPSKYSVTIPEDKNIILDINGYNFDTSVTSAIVNNGTLEIIDSSEGQTGYIYSKSAHTITNNGNLTITNTYFNGARVLDNKGTATINNSKIKRTSSYWINDKLVLNSGTLNIYNSTVYDLYNNGILNSENTKYELKIYNNKNATMSLTKGSSVTINNYGNMTIDGTTITNLYNYNIGKVSNSTINLLQNSEATSVLDLYNITIPNNLLNVSSGTVNFYSGSVTSGGTVAQVTKTATLNIYGGTLTSTSTAGDPIQNSGTLNIGNKDATVDITTPVIKGGANAIYNTGTLNFYDGIITGTTNAIYGIVNEVEPGYKINLTTNDDNTQTATLILIGNDERVAVVNGINYTDLQAAINSVEDNVETNVVIYSNITLTDNITIPENKIINLYLNGFTITYGDYNFVENGTINIIESGTPASLIGNIINKVKNVLNIDTNKKNIIIYEMEDGSKLSSEKTYTLYKKNTETYSVLKMNKDEEIGRYSMGNETEELTSIKGRLYLNNLNTGSYKLVDNDGKEISFEITTEGKLIGKVFENLQTEDRKVVATAIAELILTIQTGILRPQLIILAILISILIMLLFMIKKQKESFE